MAELSPTLTNAGRETLTRHLRSIGWDGMDADQIAVDVLASPWLSGLLATARADERERLVTAAKQIVHAAIDRAESNVGGLLIVLDEIAALAQPADTEERCGNCDCQAGCRGFDAPADTEGA